MVLFCRKIHEVWELCDAIRLSKGESINMQSTILCEKLEQPNP